MKEVDDEEEEEDKESKEQTNDVQYHFIAMTTAKEEGASY